MPSPQQRGSQAQDVQLPEFVIKTDTILPTPYSLKRNGISVMNCDDEPVHIPGCIQDHGFLLSMRPDDLLVTQVSENCQRFTGRSVEQILGQPLAAIIGEAAVRRIIQMRDSEPLENNPLYALTARMPGMCADTPALDISLHLSDGALIIELEQTGGATHCAAPPSDYYAVVKRLLARLRGTDSLAQFCTTSALEMRRVIGLDRVMMYRFHADDSGEVMADAHRQDLHSWLGLRYPASDIPKPAREIFKRIGVRPLPDVNGALSEIVPLIAPATGRALDMTYCALRGASRMYTEYLNNMGVAATLTMPILRGSHLWGLIVCHHYAPTALPYQVRAAAEFIAQMISLEMAGAESREHLRYRERIDAIHHALVNRAAGASGLAVLVEEPAGLLAGIDASGVAVLDRDTWRTAGRTPDTRQLRQLAEWLHERIASAVDGTDMYATDVLGSAYPAAAAFADIATGVLALPLHRHAHGELILWFRSEQLQTFSWAGNPHEKPSTLGEHGLRLTPRRSFDIWQEQVRGRSLPWSSTEVDAAVRLRGWLLELVAGRAKELAEFNARLARSNAELDAFAYVAGHDLKEPLRGIYKNAYYLMEEASSGRALDARATARLESVLRLAGRMDNLLDALLHFARVSHLSLTVENTDLGAVLLEALDMIGARLIDSGIEIRIARPLPCMACDRICVREVLLNLLSNAVKYRDKSNPWVEIGWLDANDENDATPAHARPLSAPAETAGQHIFYVRDNGIGIDMRHRERVFVIFKRLHPRDAFGGGSGAGLSIARKLVEQHDGRIWFDAEPGVGSTFYFTLAGIDSGIGRFLPEVGGADA